MTSGANPGDAPHGARGTDQAGREELSDLLDTRLGHVLADLDSGIWLASRGDEVALVAGALPSGERPRWWPSEDEVPELLGRLAGVPVWGIELDDRWSADAEDDIEWVHLFALADRVGPPHWALAGRATQMSRFRRTHRFCSVCGTATRDHAIDRARECPECGHVVHPPVSPAIITLVERGDEVLLAHGAQFPLPVYSALAGFVEPGETAEAAVRREVAEEVGVVVGNVRYQASQPWPFPHSLMLGFTCEWVSGDIVIDDDEIVDAGWFTAGDMPPMFPGRTSIANWLIADWLDRQGGA